MSMMFNTQLSEAQIELQKVRLLRHKDNRSSRGRSPFELWRDNRPLFDLYQSTQSLHNATKLGAEYWASFVGTATGETLFVGLFAVSNRRVLDRDLPQPHADGVDLAGSCHLYDLCLVPQMSDLIGRLVIDWGSGDRAWIQRADKQDKQVVELRREFQEPDFPGFLNLIEPLSKLGSIPTGWKTALRSAKGVYLLTCPRTREQYVGSALGNEGFWQRWQEYARSGHGGNVGLKNRDRSDYQVSILEVAGTSSSDVDIIGMEQRWKLKLQSREMGLNKN